MHLNRFGRTAVVAAATLALGLTHAAVASAQTHRPRWEVDVVGGLSRFDLPTSGTVELPPPGPPLTTSGPISPSRQIPTWFLSDGASLVNGVNAEFGVAARITPLDAALGSLGTGASQAPVLGLRVRRVLTSHLAFEVSADVLQGSTDIPRELLQAAEVSRASFETAMTGLLTTGPFSSVSVSATVTESNQNSRDLVTTAALRWTFSSGRTTPYLTLGGGILQTMGDLPGVTLVGNYRFQIAGSVPINETDTLQVRYDHDTALVGLGGLGLHTSVTNRIGLTLDGRVLVGRQTLALKLDADPSAASGTPEGFIESFTTPAIQFSNSAATGRESSLSGQLQNFKAFSTSGVQVRYLITAGVTFRF